MSLASFVHSPSPCSFSLYSRPLSRPPFRLPSTSLPFRKPLHLHSSPNPPWSSPRRPCSPQSLPARLLSLPLKRRNNRTVVSARSLRVHLLSRPFSVHPCPGRSPPPPTKQEESFCKCGCGGRGSWTKGEDNSLLILSLSQWSTAFAISSSVKPSISIPRVRFEPPHPPAGKNQRRQGSWAARRWRCCAPLQLLLSCCIAAASKNRNTRSSFFGVILVCGGRMCIAHSEFLHGNPHLRLEVLACCDFQKSSRAL